MPVVNTLGIWKVTPGHEEDFVSAWEDLARRTESDFPGASAVLLRDRDRRNLFISTGPWQSIEQVERWRDSQTFREGVSRIREFLDEFEPHTMDRVVTIGD